MKRPVVFVIFIFLFGIFLSVQADAEEASSAKPYSGDFWTRSTLTGDWGGMHNEWAAKGVTFDINLTHTGMSSISGGKNIGWEYAGRARGGEAGEPDHDRGHCAGCPCSSAHQDP